MGGKQRATRPRARVARTGRARCTLPRSLPRRRRASSGSLPQRRRTRVSSTVRSTKRSRMRRFRWPTPRARAPTRRRQPTARGCVPRTRGLWGATRSSTTSMLRRVGSTTKMTCDLVGSVCLPSDRCSMTLRASAWTLDFARVGERSRRRRCIAVGVAWKNKNAGWH